MAKSARASAHSPPTPAQRLALKAADRLGDLKDVHRAYVCLERFVRPIHLREHDEFSATPAELGALVAIVNMEFERLLQAMDAAGDALRKALCKAARKALKARAKG